MYGGRDSSACRTVASVASMRHAPFHTVDRSAYHVTEMTLEGTLFHFDDYTDLRLPLLGTYQPYNAATVLTALRVLNANGVTVTEEQMRHGLASTVWPARFELMRKDPLVICDGGHNPNGVSAAVKSIQAYFPEQKVNVLSGVMTDKDYDEMIEALKPIARHVYAVCPENPRALPADRFAAHLKSHKISATPYKSIKEALCTAIDDSRRDNLPLICLGSLYLYGSVVEALEQID